MMFYYSGASMIGAEQKSADLSLGGHVSSTAIPNDMLQNIFSEVSYLGIQQKKRETKMIVLKNISGADSNSLQLTTNIIADEPICKYRISFSLPDSNGCFESISDTSALPYNTSFDDVSNGDVFNLPDLANNAYLGIWITREFDFESDSLKKKTCADWKTILETVPPVEKELQESIQLTLQYSV